MNIIRTNIRLYLCQKTIRMNIWVAKKWTGASNVMIIINQYHGHDLTPKTLIILKLIQIIGLFNYRAFMVWKSWNVFGGKM